MAENKLPVWTQMTKKSEAGIDYEEAKNGSVAPRCLACGRPESIIWVHGHGQCAYCNTNVMPCCDGETCD